MMNEPLSSIMSTKIITVNSTDTLDMVKQVFDTKRVHHVPVVKGAQVVGIISTYDLYKINRPFADYESIKVKDVMTDHVAYLEPKDKIGAAAQVFLENKFHAVPIVDDGELVGLVTTFDVLHYEYLKEYPEDKGRWVD